MYCPLVTTDVTSCIGLLQVAVGCCKLWWVVASCCALLQVAVRCAKLQCVVASCSGLWQVAVCCGKLQCVVASCQFLTQDSGGSNFLSRCCPLLDVAHAGLML